MIRYELTCDARFVQYARNSYICPAGGSVCGVYCYLCPDNSIPMKYIVISQNTELIRVPADCLIFMESVGNYSHLYTLDGNKTLVSLQLGQLEDFINNQDDEERFIRVGRSLIININYVYFIDTAKQKLVMSDCSCRRYELEASRVALSRLKSVIETLTKAER
jgi:DNA-binding LytR/AlgR family response regulator